MNIYLAADHAGFNMKEAVKLFLEIEKDDLLLELGKIGRVVHDIEIIDFGAYVYDENDDYPKFISACAGALSSDIYIGKKENIGIIFGGSGQGESIVADKYKGIRAGVINNENLELVKLLREHNNANMLSIGARFVSEEFAKEAVKTFILTKFEEKNIENEESRHERRISEIDYIENVNMNTKVSEEELTELKELESMRVASLDD